MKVRRLGPGDGETWRKGVRSLVPEKDRSGELLSAMEAETALADDRCYLLLAENADERVGLLSAYRFPDVECGGSLVYLYDIEVLPSHRRLGIGKTLLRELVAVCRLDGVDLIWAGTETSNHPARKTFVATGGRLEGSSYAEYEWDLE